MLLLAEQFIKKGHTKKNEKRYQTLDTQISQAALAAAKKVAKKKYGYMRNDELVNCGRQVILYKTALDCKGRGATQTSVMVRRSLALEVPLAQLMAMTCIDIRREARKQRVELWDTQKRCEAGRIEWLENEVRKRAQAHGDDNWEKNLNDMIRVAEERSTNRKLVSITKGINDGVLDCIEVATHDWFHSVQMRELYHHEAGNLRHTHKRETINSTPTISSKF